MLMRHARTRVSISQRTMQALIWGTGGAHDYSRLITALLSTCSLVLGTFFEPLEKKLRIDRLNEMKLEAGFA
jgi:hypothetical protein